jgi:hypothetical protein
VRTSNLTINLIFIALETSKISYLWVIFTGSMDIALDTLGLVQRRLNELGRKFDSSFQMLMLAQNLFLESCHRIQLDEPQLEIKLTKVLERILDAITNR